MSDLVKFRTFKDGDYNLCCEWWKSWWGKTGPVPEAYLPPRGRCYMIEMNGKPVAASFLYADELMGYLTWTISDPEYREANRKKLIELLITKIQEDARDNWGVKFILTVCGNKHLEKIHRKLDWYVEDSNPAYECFKYL